MRVVSSNFILKEFILSNSSIVKIILPFREAIEKSIKQNFDRDVRCKHMKERELFKYFSIYLEEVIIIFQRINENYEPELPDIEHYVVLQDEEWKVLKQQYQKPIEFIEKIKTLYFSKNTGQVIN